MTHAFAQFIVRAMLADLLRKICVGYANTLRRIFHGQTTGVP
ncbi:MAG: hypothetical protein P8M10_03860 [Ilumatobacter sp.]|nr:hypothetical protein [Ilumatobacter sp.]MDG2438427.1 hypothetical protein [Ilumatobacter sp.]